MIKAIMLSSLIQLNESSRRLLQYLDGSKERIANSYIPIVDVRDVAQAHIAAAENQEASGRYLLAPHSEHWTKIINILKDGEYPGVNKAKIPSKTEDSGKFLSSTDKRKKLHSFWVSLSRE
jgi:nucleoside-diphosphate-sugar epimerase